MPPPPLYRPGTAVALAVALSAKDLEATVYTPKKNRRGGAPIRVYALAAVEAAAAAKHGSVAAAEAEAAARLGRKTERASKRFRSEVETLSAAGGAGAGGEAEVGDAASHVALGAGAALQLPPVLRGRCRVVRSATVPADGSGGFVLCEACILFTPARTMVHCHGSSATSNRTAGCLLPRGERRILVLAAPPRLPDPNSGKEAANNPNVQPHGLASPHDDP